jgi:hypothetical protein
LAYGQDGTFSTAPLDFLWSVVLGTFGADDDFVFAGTGRVRRIMRSFLFRSLVFLVTAILITVAVFFLVNSYKQGELTTESTLSESAQSVASEAKKQTEQVTEALKEQVPDEGVPLKSLPLTETHQRALAAVKIDVDTFVLTEAMIICAGEKIGSERMTEIIEGNAPSVLEMTKLIPCLGA